MWVEVHYKKPVGFPVGCRQWNTLVNYDGKHESPCSPIDKLKRLSALYLRYCCGWNIAIRKGNGWGWEWSQLCTIKYNKKGDDIDYYENKIQWKNENLEYTIYSVNGL